MEPGRHSVYINMLKTADRCHKIIIITTTWRASVLKAELKKGHGDSSFWQSSCVEEREEMWKTSVVLERHFWNLSVSRGRLDVVCRTKWKLTQCLNVCILKQK